MTSAICFFCTQEEERVVWEYLNQGDVAALLIDPFDLNSVTPVNFEILPPWPEPLAIYFHHKPSGPLHWHRNIPALKQQPHDALVNSLLAQNKWRELNLPSGSAMLDVETSPMQIYFRPRIENGQIGPSELVCPPSNARRISNDYQRWVERSKSWIRRKTVRIHDWRHRTELLPNPLGIATSLYAFPKAREEIESRTGKYAILIR